MSIFLSDLRLLEFGSETVRVCVRFSVSVLGGISGSKVGVVFGQESPRTKRGCEGIPLSLLRHANALEGPSRVDGQFLRPKAPMRGRLVAARLDRYRFLC